ncbi:MULTISPECIES: hypothetical protein [Metabacillus]|uniref:Uncharacterized protein n=3 Tax=Metabacillus TaxID=2675233 RepID=A0A179SY43_9BACI|nr:MULTISPECIES: hypothetical protein [Metabacillus]OAS85222.1 hypothetical protein A6K24_06865 [Metabacillus litoralis]QNF26113.1 hypothetical protein HUW50_00235 [Metabacillus sp. KUDC1714]
MVFLLIACIIALLGLLLLRKSGLNDESMGNAFSLFLLGLLLVLLYFGNFKWNLNVDDRGIFNTIVGIVCLFFIPGSIQSTVSLFTNNKDVMEKASGYGCFFIIMGGILFFIIGIGGAFFDLIFNPEPDCIVMENGQSNCTDVEGGPGDYNNPGIHEVEGHFRGGSYIEPYIRSNPDGDTSNNLNP